VSRLRVLALAGAVLAATEAARTAESADVRFDQWTVPQATMPFVPHDPAFAADGSGWYTAFGGNTLGQINPTTGSVKEFPLPTPDSGPHGIIADRDGRIWYTGNRAALIGRLDPASGKVTEYRMPDAAARDPHTLVFDARGLLWFTVQNGNFVGRLDPASGAITLKAVATPKAMPHGIAISPGGDPYFAMAGANKIGRIDPRTLEITEYTLPDGARPRRLAAVADNAIWYGDNARGFLSRLDPRSGQVKEFASPGGAKSAPYSIAATRGAIWYTESEVQPNVLVRFDLQSETTQTWPVPSRGSVVRHMVAMGDSTLWLACSGTGVVVRARVVAAGQGR
jgi:virginiamycin B lyase